MTPGQWVEIRQPSNRDGLVWLPMLVTHVHDDDDVSGVAFTGMPAAVGWSRPSQAFQHVERGDGESNRQWRENGLAVSGGVESVDIAEAVKEATAGRKKPAK